uniref:E3 ubiquitin-protein ligase RNF14 n=1 Tax=Neogobius melanostomus TaxID=47308 RepID=A0A8C6SEJ9_9GOBI
MSEDKEAQEDELLALASIYDEEEFRRAECAQGGEVQVSVELCVNFFGLCVPGEKQSEYNVCFLPPLVLNFEFPEDYPSTSPPVYTLSSKWMTRAQMSSLCRHLDELWDENQGCVILFTWIQFLKEEVVDFLGIKSPLEDYRGALQKHAYSCSSVAPLDSRAVALLDPRLDLLPQLLDYDEAQRQRLFDGKVFCCGICFSEKLGASCLCFKECQHVYCKACMSEYFQIQIKDGNVQCLNCPEPKCSSVATPLQVKQLVGEELFARYDRLLLQSSLDLMADVVYCPRVSCGTPVMVEPDSTMGICSGCQYAFCTLCKMGYHGVSHCKLPTEELRDLRDEYLSASVAGQKFMEQRFGKKSANNHIINLADGCNKMTCTSCKQYFCWLCLGALSRGNPYSHFNNPQSPCFNQLFFGVDPDDDDNEFWSDDDD